MKVGFIGLGLMGEVMSSNILKKLECQLYVYDLNKDKVSYLEKQGAISCASAIEVAVKSDIVITVVPKSEHVISIHNELYKAVKKNQLFIDMSTIDPEISRKLAQKLNDLGASMIDAPIVKSRPAAVDGTLGIFVGGSKTDYLRALPVLECMGKNLVYMGDNGSGLTMKLMHNMLVGAIQNGVNEMLLLSENAGINIDDFVKAISYGGGQNFYLDKKGKKIINRDFETSFSVENMNKDTHLVENLINKYNLDLPTAKHVVNIYDQAMKFGYQKEDFSATFKVVEKNSKKS